MKALIVICVIVLLLQFAALGVSFSRGNGGDAPTVESVKNRKWKLDPEKFPLASRLERLYDPYRPRITLPWDKKAFPGLGTKELVAFGHGAKQRIAKFELTGGGGVLIRYACSDAERCPPQVVCLCPAGAAVPTQDFMQCGDAAPPMGQCAKDGNIGVITVFAETGTLEFSGLGQAGGAVRQR